MTTNPPVASEGRARAEAVLAEHGIEVLNGAVAYRANVFLGDAIVSAMLAFAAPPASGAGVREDDPTDGDYWNSTTGEQREDLFATLNGVQLGGDVAEIPDAIDRIITILRPHRPEQIRAMKLADFLPAAERIVNSGPVISIFAACEWDEWHDDGKQWIAGIVRETIAQHRLAAFPTAEPEPAIPAGMVLVPLEPTEAWASTMANIRQGRSSTPRCEPPSEANVRWARERIAEVLEAAKVLAEYAPKSAAPAQPNHPPAQGGSVCATCGFPWGVNPVRHAEICDNRVKAQGEGQTAGSGVRERIARIIDPEEWRLHDIGMAKDPPVPSIFISGSLGKADEIVAALSAPEDTPKPQPAEGEQVGLPEYCSNCTCDQCQAVNEKRAIASALDSGEPVQCWSCPCGWVGCYTTSELAEFEVTECQRCYRERLVECEPPRDALPRSGREGEE